MFGKYKRKVFSSIFLLFFGIIFIFLPSNIPFLDKKNDDFFETVIKKSVLTYATVRGINAIVSVAKETEISATPLGVGIDIHIGEILDPIDDAIERLSSTLTISMAGIFLLKIFSEIFDEYFSKIFAILLILTSLVIWIPNKDLTKFFTKIIMLIIFIRIVFPVSSVLNNFLYLNYFEPKIDQNVAILRSIYQDNSKIKEKNYGIIKSVKEETKKVGELLERLKENADKIVMAVIDLIFLNIGLLFIQIILIPLGIIFFMQKIFIIFIKKY